MPTPNPILAVLLSPVSGLADEAGSVVDVEAGVVDDEVAAAAAVVVGAIAPVVRLK